MKRIFLLSALMCLTLSSAFAQTISLPCNDPAIMSLGLTGPSVGTVYDCNNCTSHTDFTAAAAAGYTHMSTDMSTNCGGVTPCHADFNVTDMGSSNYSFGDSSEVGSAQVSYAWDYGDGSFDVGQFPAPHNYATSGYKMACLAIFDSSNSCPSTTCRVIMVGASGGCNPMFTATTQCGITTFTDISTGTYTDVGWDFGDGSTYNSQPGQAITYNYAAAGNYNVSISLSGGGCNASSGPIPVTVTFPSINAGFTYAATGTSSPYSVTFTNTSTGASNYTWYFGDGSADTAMTPAVHSYDSCDYTVWLIAQDANFCTDTFAMQINACSNGISDIHSSLNSMSIFPNPVKENLLVTINSDENLQGFLSVKDIMGKNALNEQQVRINRGRNSYNLNLETLPSGIYLVQIRSGNSIESTRVLKK